MESEHSNSEDSVENDMRELRALSDFIHDNPETAFREFKAADAITAFLEKRSFTIERALIPELPTSFKAVFKTGAGNREMVKLAITAEYDALAELGHGCGHNLITACSCAAAMKLKDILAKTNAEITIVGTPGEEQYGGKVKLCNAGIFNDFDCAMTCHPYTMNSTDMGACAVSKFIVRYHGRASHAGNTPELGINALDAMIMFFNGIALWRQRLPSNARVHGIITNGGQAPNIIPELTEAFMYLRLPDACGIPEMERNFKDVAQGAATASGCTLELIPFSTYMPEKINPPLNEAFADAMEKAGEKVRRAKGNEWHASTDFGNVSHIIPVAHCFFDITHGNDISLHTKDFREAAATDYAFDQAMKAASAMAETLARAATDANFRIRVKEAF